MEGTFTAKLSVRADRLLPGYVYALVATSDPNGLVHQVAVTTASVSDADHLAPTVPAASNDDNTTVRDNGDGTTSVFTAEMSEDGSVTVTETRVPSSQAPKAKVGNTPVTASSQSGHTVSARDTAGRTTSDSSSKPQLAHTGAEGVAGIAGVSGTISSGIPVRFHLKDIDMGRDKQSNVKVIEDKDMTPTLAATALYNMLNKTLDRSGAGTAKITYTISPRNGEQKSLTRTNMFYSSESISEKTVDEFYNVIDVLMNNRFINYEIADINVETEVTQDKKTAKLVDAAASSTVVSPGDTIVVDVTLEPYRGEKVNKEVFFTVPKDQPLGKYTLEVRGGGEIPLPYVLEKQKYNLTDEVLRRLKVYKDFNDLFDELQKTDTNNQIVVEILEDGVSLVNEEASTSSVKKAKLQGVEDKPSPGDLKKKKGSEDLSDGKDDEKKNEKTAIDTEYIVQGDGQFTIQVMSVKDRDKALAKRAKEAKEQVKMEHKLELEDQGNKKDSKASQNKKDKSVNKPSKEKPSKDKPAGDAPSNEKPSNDKPSNDQVE